MLKPVGTSFKPGSQELTVCLWNTELVGELLGTFQSGCSDGDNLVGGWVEVSQRDDEIATDKGGRQDTDLDLHLVAFLLVQWTWV